VVAEPGPRRVHRDHERVRLLQVLQHSSPAAAPGQQVGQLAVDPFQHAGPQQQPPDVLALPVQDLGQQVFGDRALAAGELLGEPLRIRVPGQRQRRQPQPRRPPLGPVHQQRQYRPGHLHPGRGEQRPRLGRAEPQIVRADLGQLSLQPQPVQSQPQIVPGRQHEPQVLGCPHDQQLQLPPRLVRAQFVHVVEYQPQRLVQRRQVLQQPLDYRPPVQVGRRGQFPNQRRPRRRPAQRVEHRQPESLWIMLVPPDRHPCGVVSQALLADPGSQQHRLAAARRC
jgi:hypothetical protein